MDPDSQKKFDRILAKDIGSLTPADMIFLRARRDYLTPEQQANYLEQPKESRLTVNMSYRELQVKAKELGLKFRVGMTKAELSKLVEDHYIL